MHFVGLSFANFDELYIMLFPLWLFGFKTRKLLHRSIESEYVHQECEDEHVCMVIVGVTRE
jgi:hypothetical protein